MDADHQKSAFASKRGVPKCPFGELYVLHFQTDDFFKTKFCGKQDIISTCGSTNVDFRSFENNFESNIFFYQQEMALRMKEVFLNDMELCEEKNIAFNYGHNATVKGYRKINLFFIRLWESLTRLLSPLL